MSSPFASFRKVEMPAEVDDNISTATLLGKPRRDSGVPEASHSENMDSDPPTERQRRRNANDKKNETKRKTKDLKPHKRLNSKQPSALLLSNSSGEDNEKTNPALDLEWKTSNSENINSLILKEWRGAAAVNPSKPPLKPSSTGLNPKKPIAKPSSNVVNPPKPTAKPLAEGVNPQKPTAKLLSVAKPTPDDSLHPNNETTTEDQTLQGAQNVATTAQNEISEKAIASSKPEHDLTISDLYKPIKHYGDKIDNINDNLAQSTHNDEIFQTELTDLKQRVNTQDDVIKLLIERLETCEARLALQQTEITENKRDIVSGQDDKRRHNLIFHGVQETDTKAPRALVKEFLDDIGVPGGIGIVDTVYRIGPKPNDKRKTRPIFCQLSK